MTLYLRKIIGNLSYKLNGFKLSERIGVLCCITLIPLLAWDLFVRQAQVHLSTEIDQKILQQKKKAKLLGVEKDRIEQQVSAPDFKSRLKEYHALKNEIASYQKKVMHYRQKTLSEKKLVVMLNALFSEVKPLDLLTFVSISEPDKGTLKKGETKKNDNNALMRKYYQLHLRGNYFSIMTYLKKIEGLSWQLYWDEMYYHVDEYPLANLELTFHAMSKDNQT